MKGPLEPLTERQMQVLHLVAHGLTYAQIGERLGIDVETSRYHVKQMRMRGGWRTNEMACAWYGYHRAEQAGLIRAAARLHDMLREESLYVAPSDEAANVG